MDSNFLEIVLDECGSVTKDNEIFVYNPLQLCRNLITEGYSMDQLVHFFSENVYRMVLDKKFFFSVVQRYRIVYSERFLHFSI